MGFQIRYITKQKTKVNNHYKIIHYKKTFDALIKNKTITSLGRYKSSFYINKRKLFFKEEVDRMYYELLGNSIAEYLNINYTYYEPTIIKTATREIKGLVAKDYRREGYSLVKFNKLLNGVIPTGVISGGELSRLGESNTVNIAKMQINRSNRKFRI